MSQKRTYEEVKQAFEEEGYTLVSKEYVNNATPLEVICPNGHEWKVRWGHFASSIKSRCRQGICDKRKPDFEFVKKTFEEQGYTLLSTEYVNTHSLLKTLCPNGHEYNVSWANFTSPFGYGENEGKGRKGCRQCSYENSRKTLKEIKAALKEKEYEHVSGEYKNYTSKLVFRCPEGHKYESTWNNFQMGCECPICATEKWVSQTKLGEIIKEIFSDVTIESEYRAKFLGRLRLDYFIPEMNLAFEYDGGQHFMPVTFGGITIEEAEENLKITQKRDKKKNKLCKQNSVELIRIKYDEPLTLEHIKKRIQEVNECWVIEKSS